MYLALIEPSEHYSTGLYKLHVIRPPAAVVLTAVPGNRSRGTARSRNRGRGRGRGRARNEIVTEASEAFDPHEVDQNNELNQM